MLGDGSMGMQSLPSPRIDAMQDSSATEQLAEFAKCLQAGLPWV